MRRAWCCSRSVRYDATKENAVYDRSTAAAQIEDILEKAAEHLNFEEDLSNRDYVLRAAQDAYSRLR